MGYTPLFDSLTKGSLCGKWPDIGLWTVVLSMADWRGEIRATHQYIASVTGLGVEDVRACMARFCEPDQESGSSNDEGRRLLLLNDEGGWGWKVVNIQKYRDKASGADQVADGRNAEKVRKHKERHRQTPADTGRHRQTPADTYSYSRLQTPDSDQEKSFAREDAVEHAEWETLKASYPAGAVRQDWNGAEHAARRLVESGETWQSLRDAVSRYAANKAATSDRVMDPVKFFTAADKPWKQLWPIPPPKKSFAQAQQDGVAARFLGTGT